MAITLNSVASQGWIFGGSPFTYSHVVVAGEDRIMLVGFWWNNSAYSPTGVTYAGQALARHPDSPGIYIPVANHCMDWWYMKNPPVGTANVSITMSTAPSIFLAVSSVYDNVNQDDPFGGWEQNFCTCLRGQVTDSIATDVDEKVVMLYNCRNAVTSVNPLLGITERIEQAVLGSAFDVLMSGDENGASPTQDYGGEFPVNNTYTAQLFGTTLLPTPPTPGRSVKYFYDMWSSEPKIRDDAGREVPLNEVRPNNWIEAEGIAIPTMVPAENNIVDPSRSLIIEVNADDKQGTIKTDISQFADVLIARASAGRG